MSKMRLAILIVLIAALGLGAAFMAAADEDVPTVVFDVESHTFSFENCQAYTYGDGNYYDLFPSLRNVMPGDVLSQNIKVRCTNIGLNRVRMYLEAVNPNEDYAALLHEAVDGSGNAHPATLEASFNSVPQTALRKLLGFDAADGRTLNYTEPIGKRVYLGAYSGSATNRDVTITLNVPIEAGNELQNLTATVDWVFVAELYAPTGVVKPNPTEKPPIEPVYEEDRVWYIPVQREYHMAYIIGRPDGLVHPELLITRAEAATIFFRLMTDEMREYFWTTENVFEDVPSNQWYNNAISTMASAGVVQGYPDGSFRPDAYITRAECISMVYRYVQAKDTVENVFGDVQGHWAEKPIYSAHSLGIVFGFEDGQFRPDDQLTRAQAIAICNRLTGRTPHIDGLLEDMILWPDNMDKTRWYYLDIQEATNEHDYQCEEDIADGKEFWTKLKEPTDWKKYEQYIESEHTYRSND